jgi:hypothetical protein
MAATLVWDAVILLLTKREYSGNRMAAETVSSLLG